MQAIRDDKGIWNITGLEHWTATYNGMIDMLKNNKSFKFARYGDGEIYCMKGRTGANCDNHIYFPELGADLRASITEEPSYMVGIQPLSVSHIPEDVNHFFGHFKRLYNADALHNASIAGDLSCFTKAMEGRYVILVGPAHLACIFLNCVHIVTPAVNCWLSFKAIRDQISFHLDGINNAVVLLAASMMSEVIISRFEDAPHTFIDCGSVFDPYAGVKSRKYHFKLKV